MKIIYFISICFLITYITSKEAGIRISINKSLIQNFISGSIPRFNPLISRIQLPNKVFEINDILGKSISISIQNSYFSIDPLNSNSLNINFFSPNTINIESGQITGKGVVNIDTDFFILSSEIFTLEFNINDLILNANITLFKKESSEFSGKYYPYAQIENLEMNLNVDLVIEGGIIDDIIDLILSAIKKELGSLISQALKPMLISFINSDIYQLTSNFPEYFGYEGIDIDYSLVKSPQIIDNFLILSMNGQTLSAKYPKIESESNNNITLPLYTNNSYSMQFLVSENFFNSLLKSLYNSKYLKYTVRSSEIPLNFPIQLNMKTLNMLFQNITNYFPSNAEIYFDIQSSSFPSILLTNGEIQGSFNAMINLFIENSQNKYTNAVTFSFDFEFALNFSVNKHSVIQSAITNIEFSNGKLFQSSFPNLNISESITNLNKIITSSIENVNKEISHLKISVPDNVQGNIQDRFITFEIQPNF